MGLCYDEIKNGEAYTLDQIDTRATWKYSHYGNVEYSEHLDYVLIPKYSLGINPFNSADLGIIDCKLIDVVVLSSANSKLRAMASYWCLSKEAFTMVKLMGTL